MTTKTVIISLPGGSLKGHHRQGIKFPLPDGFNYGVHLLCLGRTPCSHEYRLASLSNFECLLAVEVQNRIRDWILFKDHFRSAKLIA